MSTALKNTWQFFAGGGVFMVVIVLCSVLALASIVFKLLSLRKDRIVPDRLARQVEGLDQDPDPASLGRCWPGPCDGYDRPMPASRPPTSHTGGARARGPVRR